MMKHHSNGVSFHFSFPLFIILISLIFTSCSRVTIVTKENVPKRSIPTKIGESPEIEKARHDFHSGEKLFYKVEWLGLNVANAIVEIEDIVKIKDRKGYKIKLVANTNGLIARVFPVHNEYLSYIDARNINSLKNETERHEGKRVKKNETLFDSVNKKAYYTDLLKNRKKVIDIPEKTYDVLGAAYYFRTLNIKIGDIVNYNIFSDGKVYPLYANIKKREDLSIRNFKTFKTFLIEPYIIRNGKKDDRAKVKVYFSADKERIPVYISLKGPIFTRISICLQSIEKKQESLQAKAETI